MSADKKKIVVILSFALMVAMSLFSIGIAYAGGVSGLGLLGIWFFMTFGIIVVLAQLIPAGILFVAMINGIFTPSRRNEVPVEVV